MDYYIEVGAVIGGVLGFFIINFFMKDKEKGKEKFFYRQKVVATQKMIWDLEFKRSKTRRVREEVRQQFDDGNAKLTALKEQIVEQAKNPTMEKGEIARLDDKQVNFEKEITRLGEHLEGLSLEINGIKPSEKYPDGVIGIDEQIDAFRELIGDFKDYAKHI